MNYLGGLRNGFSFGLTGLDIEAKAALIERQVLSQFPGGRDHFGAVRTQLIRSDKDDPATNEEAVAVYRITVKDRDERKVGRAFSNVAVEFGLASIPGFFGTGGGPGPAQPYGVHWPAFVPSDVAPQVVTILGEGSTGVENTAPGLPAAPVQPLAVELPPAPSGPTRRVPLGLVCGARSGDKGGNANVGLFTRSATAFAWLDAYLDVERFHELFPDADGLEVRRHRLANLWPLNFVIVGMLEEGVAASTRLDDQAKGFGEYVRARVVDVPESLLAPA